MTTPAKIEPCPFCGADGVIEKPPKGMRGYSSLVGCSNKDCRLGSVAFDSLEEWNRRAHAPKQEWEAKEKALLDWIEKADHHFFCNKTVNNSGECTCTYDDIIKYRELILNTPAASGKEEI